MRNVQLDAETVQAAEDLGKVLEVSPNAVMRRAVKGYVKALQADGLRVHPTKRELWQKILRSVSG